MKIIALYVVVGFYGNIFVTADEQRDTICSHGKYEQCLPTYVVGFTLFIYNFLYLLNVHLVLFISDSNQRVVLVLLFTIIIQLEKYAEVCKLSLLSRYVICQTNKCRIMQYVLHIENQYLCFIPICFD